MVSEFTGFNNAGRDLLAMKRACTDPPSVKASSDSPLLSWTWIISRSILEGKGLCRSFGATGWGSSACCRAHSPLSENESFCPLVWRQPSYGKSVPGWIVCSAASPKQYNTNRCVNFSIQCNEVLVAKQSFGDLNCLMCIRLWKRFKINHE